MCASSLNAVVSYRNSTSNHNRRREASQPLRLYLIEILHQTTTKECLRNRRNMLYLIEILHQTTTRLKHQIDVFQLYLIEILHQTTTRLSVVAPVVSLYLIEILHQTTTTTCDIRNPYCCILSKFYIKPQLMVIAGVSFDVVSYRNSTSNHNVLLRHRTKRNVVSYRNSTSNHNFVGSVRIFVGCILSKFYIKPQHLSVAFEFLLVVSYRNSTSNHNHGRQAG